LQYPVQAPDVPVAPAVALPVEFRQVRVPVELADDAVVPGHVQGAGHLLPAVQLGRVQARPLVELTAPGFRQLTQHVEGVGQHPGGGDVGVRVVVQAGPVGAGVGVVVLVGADDAPDAVPAEVRVVGRRAGPEAGDLQQHLGAPGVQELGVAGGRAV